MGVEAYHDGRFGVERPFHLGHESTA